MYVDAILDRKLDKIRIAERHPDHTRVLRDIPAPYVFYYEHPAGTHRSLFGHRLKKFSANNAQKFRAELQDHHGRHRIFESDINPVFRALATNYHGTDAPDLHLGFFDIEAGFDPDRGFAPTTDPFNEITAITLYRSFDTKLLTFVLKPCTLTDDEATTIASQFENTTLFTDERALLAAFLAAIDDVDVLTSWNGSAYDIPYLVNRIAKKLGKEVTKRLCLWDQLPAEREYKNKFGKTVKTFDLVGRVHLDYLELYAKHNPQQRLSYALNSIGQQVVGETKTPYEGTLDDLYKKDFPKFIEYNRQDVMLMVKIDQQLKYIELHNQIAHANTVILKTTMGSVAWIEQAIINEMHEVGLICPDRKSDDGEACFETDVVEEDADADDGEHAPVVGAYVADPKIGLRTEIGCVDINSLYPSSIRALNMSPETLVGQVRLDETMRLVNERAAKLSKTERAEAWDGLFSTIEFQHMHVRNDQIVTVDFFDLQTGDTTTCQWTGEQLYDYVFDQANHVCISANGTIFRTDVEGVVPRLLGRWYSERKEMQSNQKAWGEKRGIDPQADYWVSFWNARQQLRKIALNSVYGAMLNRFFKLYDDRLGQSTTLTGRTIVQHMNAQINQIIAGKYDYKGDAIQYSDTDSAYFSAAEYAKIATEDSPGLKPAEIAALIATREDTIAFYDAVAALTNETFPKFMQETFNTSLERGAIIRAGRELVAGMGLFIKKKKYGLLMYDKEGKRLDKDGKPGELKAMGLDLKRSDTPRYMQDFLEKLLFDLLTDTSQDTMHNEIKAFRRNFKSRPGWEKGSPKKVSDLTGYSAKLKAASGIDLRRAKQHQDKVRLPGHVLASMNWNMLCEMFHDHYATPITDGTRIIVCKLRPNSFGMTSVAYPVDEPHLPKWFKEMPFDDEAMEETIVDNKIGNLVGVLEWDLGKTKETVGDEFFAWNI